MRNTAVNERECQFLNVVNEAFLKSPFQVNPSERNNAPKQKVKRGSVCNTVSGKALCNSHKKELLFFWKKTLSGMFCGMPSSIFLSALPGGFERVA